MLQLDTLLTTANEELAQVEAAKTDLTEKNTALSSAQQAVTDAQSAVDTARGTLTTEKTEAIAAVRAIVEVLNDKITELEA